MLATPALEALGLRATALFIPPAVLTGYVLLRHQQRSAAHGTAAVFTLLCLLPVPAVALSLLLPEPAAGPSGA